jgi:hypothetical protein
MEIIVYNAKLFVVMSVITMTVFLYFRPSTPTETVPSATYGKRVTN